MNALGYMIAPFITVTCINEIELSRSKYPFGCIIVAIDGLCPGRNTDLRNKTAGYITFIQTEKGDVNNTRYKWTTKT